MVVLAAVVSSVCGCNRSGAQREQKNDGPTTIVVTDKVIHNGVRRLGMNLGGQNYWDSGQMLKNLISNNPGFEGETWQTILRCKTASATSCMDGNQWTQWPDGFLDGASFEFLSGNAIGVTGVVRSSKAADAKVQNHGVALTFDAMRVAPSADDFVLVKKSIPGNAQAGWWTNASAGASFATEYRDLAPNSPGKQALKIVAHNGSASVTSYFDSMNGHSFVQLRGTYHLAFRAKLVDGNDQMHVELRRLVDHGTDLMLTRNVSLTGRWQDYSFDFPGMEDGRQIGTVGLSFNIDGADALLDDVSLTPVSDKAANPTAYRDEVVETLRQLHPGILRYQDGDHLGSSIDNLLAVPFARMRAGYSQRNSEQTVVPTGLHEFLQLCQAVGAEPWFNLPAATSPAEMKNLVEYFSGPATTKYGAKRAALGQKAPWTTVFPLIHLELGNEEWNGVTFAGAAMPDPVAYGRRAKEVFTAARSSASYDVTKFDLVIGTFVLIPDWTQKELANSGAYDSTAVAPYLFDSLNDASSEEAVFGPMFAQPEMIDSQPSGYVAQQAKAAQSAAQPARLSVYEVNMGTSSGTVSQAKVDGAVASMGSGLAVIDHMLLMMRDLGITTQMMWALTGYANGFDNTRLPQKESTPLFGTVIDMGGPTNLRRPQYLAEELANEAILPAMIDTQISGINPTWAQDPGPNNRIELDKAHYLQSFGFSDGAKHSLILLNLSRTDTLTVAFSGDAAPAGAVAVKRLTSNKITDTNETRSNVAIADAGTATFKRDSTYDLPPFSMTVFLWTASR